MADVTHIPSQIDLPARVAVGIVIQSFRIRMGRSVITVLGVVLGIAFLMANLANQIVRDAVHEEDQMRTATGRMLSFLTAETGPLDGKTVGLVQRGPLDETEQRFVARLAREKRARLNTYRMGETPGDAAPFPSSAESLQDTRALVLLGAGAAEAFPWQTLAGLPRPMAVAVTRPGATQPPRDLPVVMVSLSIEPTADELQQAEADRRASRFRRGWVLVISILVTVMSITNAMLMSVTERFREIGTMKCLGAKAAFIRRLFFIESSLIGLVGGVAGAVVGALFSVGVNMFLYGPGLLYSVDYGALGASWAAAVLAGVALSVISAVNPANVAAAMTPAHALRSNI